GVLVLIERRAIEMRQRPVVRWKVAGHPVEDHAYAGLMAAIDEMAEVIRRAEARARRKEARALITPGLVERMLHDRQQFDMCIGQLEQIGHQAFGQLTVVVKTSVAVAHP